MSKTNVLETALVSFGNYLFQRYDVQVFSNDGTNTPLYQREVHHADVSNWISQGGSEFVPKYQNGDKVTFALTDEAQISDCTVLKVHQTEKHSTYDIEVELANSVTRLYNIEEKYLK